LGKGRSPSSLVQRFRSQLDRLFEEALELGGPSNEVAGWEPQADVVATESSILIQVEVPGIQREDLEVEIRGNLAIFRGTKPSGFPAQEGLSFERVERRHGSFERCVELHWPVNTGGAKARLEGGVLTLELPRLEERRQRSRVIPIE
jgi:HSP20 family protein